jgi:hypothetical protein
MDGLAYFSFFMIFRVSPSFTFSIEIQDAHATDFIYVCWFELAFVRRGYFVSGSRLLS